MQVHTLVRIVEKRKKRLGQGHGSGRVKTSGRGTKGQNARSARPLQFEGGALPLTKRLPFLRGKDRNKSLQLTPAVINLTNLAQLPSKTTVNINSLINYGLVAKNAKATGVKLLGNGSVDKEFTVKIPASKSAIEKIKKAGGTVE